VRLAFALLALTLTPLPPAHAGQLDHREIWQPLPHPSLPARDKTLTDLGPPSAPVPTDGAPIILVTVDTWRADRLGLYGSPRPTSPFLEELATSSVVFERASSPSPWTWPSVVSLATGLHPRAHGAIRKDAPLCPDVQTLAEVFYDAGYRTGFAGVNQYFEPEDAGYRQGFEYFWSSGFDSSDVTLDYARHFLEGLKGEPFFLHVHLFDPHCPYDPSPESLAAVQTVPYGRSGEPASADPGPMTFDVSLKNSCHMVPPPPADLQEDELRARWTPSEVLQDYYDHYDGELLQTDVALRELRELLAERDLWDDAWVVITGDHGEEFQEHGELGHGMNLYAETNHVPLLIRPPGGVDGGRRIEQAVSLVDVPRTLVAGRGLTVPSNWQGRDLGPAVRGAPLASVPVLSETMYDPSNWAAMIEYGDRRLVVSGQPAMGELYAVGDYDRTDLFQSGDFHEAMRGASLGAVLRKELLDASAGKVCDVGAMDLDPAHWEMLRKLGYVESDEVPLPEPE